MNKALPISRLIKVDINLAPNAAQIQNTSTLLIIGTSNVINSVERIRKYNSIDAVAADFGTTAPEYLAAVLWFEQSPQPDSLLIGRWENLAQPAQLIGAPLTLSQQLISNFNTQNAANLAITIDGTNYTFSSIDLTTATNLNAVAKIIQAKIRLKGANATVTWNSLTNNFIVTSGTTGTISNVSFFEDIYVGGVQLLGLPSVGDTITFDGIQFTFVNVLTGGPQIEIGASVFLTSLSMLNSVIANTILNAVASYTSNGIDTLTVITPLTNYVITTSNPTKISISAFSLERTTLGELISCKINDSGAYLVPGILGTESAVDAVALFDNMFGQSFYGVTVLSATDQDLVNVSNFIEAANNKHIHGVSTTEAGSIVAATTTDIGSQLKALNLKRTLTQYSSSNPYSAVSLLARILTTNYNANNNVITLMYKQEPGIVAETLSATEIGALEAKNINVFVAYNNNTAIIEQGKMANGYFVDEVTGTDWLALAIQNEIFNALYTSTTKIPQTDSGVHTLLTVAESVCSQGVVNGLLAPGVWNTQGFGSLSQGDYLPKGFYVYAASVNTQLSADRAARKSPPIQVAAKLAGAIHLVDVIINVNR